MNHRFLLIPAAATLAVGLLAGCTGGGTAHAPDPKAAAAAQAAAHERAEIKFILSADSGIRVSPEQAKLLEAGKVKDHVAYTYGVGQAIVMSIDVTKPLPPLVVEDAARRVHEVTAENAAKKTGGTMWLEKIEDAIDSDTARQNAYVTRVFDQSSEGVWRWTYYVTGVPLGSFPTDGTDRTTAIKIAQQFVATHPNYGDVIVTD